MPSVERFIKLGEMPISELEFATVTKVKLTESAHTGAAANSTIANSMATTLRVIFPSRIGFDGVQETPRAPQVRKTALPGLSHAPTQ
jgi:hypothetical protein